MLAVPNPNPDCLAVLAEGGPGTAELKVYSSAMVCVGTRILSLQEGWNRVAGPEDLKGLGNGLYFVELRSVAGKRSPLGLCKMLVLH